jgi:hypothetical protein
LRYSARAVYSKAFLPFFLDDSLPNSTKPSIPALTTCARIQQRWTTHEYEPRTEY